MEEKRALVGVLGEVGAGWAEPDEQRGGHGGRGG